jgi:hypothetical protein
MYNRTLLCAFTLACSLVPLTAQDTRTTPKHLLRYAFEQGKTVHAVTTQHMTMKMDLRGKPMETAMDMQLFESMTVAELKDGRARIVGRTDRIKVVAKMSGDADVDYDSDVEGSDAGPLGGIADLVGKEMEIEFDDRGKGGAVKLPEELKHLTSRSVDLEEVMQQQFHELPDAPVAVGDTWENETEMALGTGKSKVKVKSKLLEVANGKAKIEMQMLVDLDAREVPGGMKMTVEKATGTMMLDLAGWQVPAGTMDMVLTTKGGGMDSRMEVTVATTAAEPTKNAKQPAALPMSTHGEAPGRIDCQIVIRHTAPLARECKAIGTAMGCTDAEHWAVELRWSERKIVVATDGKMLEKLDAPLLQLAKATAAKPKPDSNDPEVDAVVSIRAAPDAPYAQVQQVIEHVSNAGVRWIAIAVAGGDNKPAERSLTVLLPPAKAEDSEQRVPAEIRFQILRDSQTGTCRRRFVTRIVSDDAEMQHIVQDCHADFERINRPDAPGVVEGGTGVPWQQAVDVIGAFRAAELWYVRFDLRPRPK